MSTLSNGAAVAFEGLTVRYGKTTAVDGVSLRACKGDVYALLGRNGSGKTSMIRCLLGQMKASAGSAALFGLDAWQKRQTAMSKVGVVPETPDMPSVLTAREIVAFCARLYPSWDGKSVAARLARFGVPDKVPFGRLSRGQKNQLALALALGPMPELLVLDDPTLGLDAVVRKEFFEELVGDLADRGTTVFITTHDLQGIEGIATHAGILKEGRLLLNEEMESLKGRFRTLSWSGHASPPSLAALSPLSVRHDAWGTQAMVEAFDYAAFGQLAHDLSPAEAQASSLSLEELFIALTGAPEPASEGEEGGKP